MQRAIVGIVVLAGVLLAVVFLPLPWPDRWVGTHLVNAVEVSAPPPRVFAYVATPANWPRWHPASRAVRGVVGRTPGVGESVVETFEIAGRRDEATWTTVELDPPRRWRFTASATGGGHAEIAYTLTPAGDGTRFVREVAYRGPNLAFAILDRLKIRAIMASDSAAALANVKRDVEAAQPR